MINNAQLLSLLVTLLSSFSFGSLAKAQVLQQEKVYVHTNKPNYNLGDTLWFKAYVTHGSRNVLSQLSGSVYVDLINGKDSISRSVRLSLSEGTASGDLILGDDLHAGIYRIRAYTQWMRNKGPDYFFDRSFTVSNIYAKEAKSVASTSYLNIDGKMYINTNINYKDANGKPIAGRTVKYKVISEYNTVSTNSVKTDEQGNIRIPLVENKDILGKKVYIETLLRLGSSTEILEIVPLNVAKPDTDVQFFPEGGNLIEGVKARVGFKAVGVNGSGVQISGAILDDQGKRAVDFLSSFAGIGSFEFQPEAGRTYKAQITFPNEPSRTIVLPKAFPDKLALSVSQSDDAFVSVMVKSNLPKNSQSPGWKLFVQSGGEQIFSETLVQEQLNSEIKLQRSLFPAGIATVTLYDQADLALSERVFFVKKEASMNLAMSSDQQQYETRSRVQMQVSPLSAEGKLLKGKFSVSVVSESEVPEDEHRESTIYANLLLSSDLKGYIESPNYYFSKKGDPEIDRQLDNLMLTQGYRKFVLKDFRGQTIPAYEADGIGLKVTGMVKTLRNKPVAGSRVSLIALNSGIMEITRTDKDGRFVVEGMKVNDGVKFYAQAKSPKGSDKVEVIVEQPVYPEVAPNKNGPDFNVHQSKIIEVQSKPQVFQFDRSRRLKEVKILARKLESIKFSAQGAVKIPEGHADQTFVFSEKDRCGTLGTCLQGRIHGVVFKQLENKEVMNYPHCRPIGIIDSTARALHSMDLYVDGRKITDTAEMAGIFDGNLIDFEAIGKIEVIRTNLALVNTLVSSPKTGLKASLLIITKRRDQREPPYAPNIMKFMPRGFTGSREFYSPKYEVFDKKDDLDYRNAIYWNPFLISNQEEPLKFDFYTSDIQGNYRVTVEGIDEDGNLGRQTFRFNVK